MFEVKISLTGLDTLAASISDLAEALKAGVTATEVIAKASTRKPRTPAPAAAAVEAAPGNVSESGPTDTDTPDTPTSTAQAAETPASAPEPSKPAAPSEPSAAHQAEAATFNAAAKDKPTIAEVRAALGALAKVDKARALAILTKRNAPSVSSLAEEHYAAVLAECK